MRSRNGKALCSSIRSPSRCIRAHGVVTIERAHEYVSMVSAERIRGHLIFGISAICAAAGKSAPRMVPRRRSSHLLMVERFRASCSSGRSWRASKASP